STHCVSIICFFFLLIPRPLSSTLFPYTTLFRSGHSGIRRQQVGKQWENKADSHPYPEVVLHCASKFQEFNSVMVWCAVISNCVGTMETYPLLSAYASVSSPRSSN